MLNLMLVFAGGVSAQDESLEKIKWTYGPSDGKLGQLAKVKIPYGFMFAGAEDTRKLMESMQNPVSGAELGFLSPEGGEWFVVYEYDETGYIRDDEKGSLDAAAMLASIQKGTEESNKMRRERGWAEMKVLGWAQEPHYDAVTHNLEWAIKGETEGHPVINYNTRILGREGVMRVTLVADPDGLELVLPKFKNTLAGFDYLEGKRYAEFREGDKVAKYGLSALVVGGAAAVAAKTGFLKWAWKLLIVGIAAIGAFLKKIIGMFKSEHPNP
jgi:uncharacterized membrane-anchored protein